MDFRTIDYTPVFDHIRQVLNLPSTVVLGMDVRPETTRPEFISPNLVDYCGIFSAVCNWVKVQRFGFSANGHGKGMWIGVDLRYESKNGGGTNGMRIFDAYYTEEGGWSFSKD